ncbi:DUF4328 domain-containing protein [Protaetiibacter sp. 10F1B-8-1]|uniref:DUF4328 domain-containing protein n=1 Tax=Protaetiibacter mangrovi TaxID=2970926 RepID=A0ABT1ZFA2_9MICO|nr:DUF4328 domain-containing protein [Protaetiibacter mangrovi]
MLSWWWALWISSSIAGGLVARLSASATTLDALIAASAALVLVDALNLAAAVLAIGVVRTIDRLQRDAAQTSGAHA